MASLENGERVALEIQESCKKFWNSASSGMTELELLDQLEQLGIRNVAFAHGTVVALFGGECFFIQPEVLQGICQSVSRKEKV